MNSEITVKLPRCKGCGICVAFCPKKVLGLSELGKVVIENPDDCIACGCFQVLVQQIVQG